MKQFEDLSPEEQKQEAEQILMARSEAEVGDPLITKFEITLLLMDKSSLFGFYSSLRTLFVNDMLNGWTQEGLAEMLGLSLNTFNTYRNALIELKIIRLEQNKYLPKNKDIIFNYIQKLPDADIQRLVKTHGREQRIRVLKELRAKVQLLTPDELRKAIQVGEEKQAQLQFEAHVKEEAQKVVTKEKEKKKAEEQRFPQQDYKSVLDGYRKYKGVGFFPHSPEEARYRKAIKNMFLSGHKVFDILECMRFFEKYHKKEGYAWMYNWTIETIMKKMPEFKAGKLKLPEIGDDIPRV